MLVYQMFRVCQKGSSSISGQRVCTLIAHNATMAGNPHHLDQFSMNVTNKEAFLNFQDQKAVEFAMKLILWEGFKAAE